MRCTRRWTGPDPERAAHSAQTGAETLKIRYGLSLQDLRDPGVLWVSNDW